jgi:hypothetical protein
MATDKGKLYAFRSKQPGPENPIDGGGGTGDDGGMDQVVKRLDGVEKRLGDVEKDLTSIKSNYATKADVEGVRTDLHKMDASIKTWMIATIVGLMFGFSGLFIAMTNILRPSSAPAQPAAQHQPPVTVNVQTPGAAATPASGP